MDSRSFDKATSPVEFRTWHEAFIAETGDKPVRLYKTGWLFLPVDLVWAMLNTSQAEIWNHARGLNPSLPVWKTVQQAFDPVGTPPGKGSLNRILRACADQNVLFSRLQEVSKKDYLWYPQVGWTALIELLGIQNEAAKDFWLEALDQVAALHGEQLPGKAPAEKIAVYCESPVAIRLGSRIAHARLKSHLSTTGVMHDWTRDQLMAHSMLIDSACVLVRFAAWVIADYVVANWDMMVDDGTASIVPLEHMVPAYDSLTVTWNRPLEICLDRYSEMIDDQSKLTTASLLGRLWSQSKGEDDPLSKTRLVRNWIQEKKGRPQWSSLQELARALVDEKLRDTHREPLPDDAVDYRLLACVLRLVETMGFMRRELSRLGLEPELVASVFEPFADEYRRAREALGKPLA